MKIELFWNRVNYGTRYELHVGPIDDPNSKEVTDVLKKKGFCKRAGVWTRQLKPNSWTHKVSFLEITPCVTLSDFSEKDEY